METKFLTSFARRKYFNLSSISTKLSPFSIEDAPNEVFEVGGSLVTKKLLNTQYPFEHEECNADLERGQ